MEQGKEMRKNFVLYNVKIEQIYPSLKKQSPPLVWEV
jgi:hypothetical protein